MFKKGFSTAEILIVLVIVGVIAVAMITMIRPSDKMYGKLAYKAYNILNTALYNINADVYEYNENLYNEANANGTTVDEDDIKKFPQNVTDLCNKLASRDEGYINTTYTNCGNILSGTGNFVDGDGKVTANPTFVASNGMRFYLFEKNWPLGVYYIYVDINGSKWPNNVTLGENKKTDLVPFFISMTNGTLLPDGVAQYDGSYLMARIVYATPNLENGQSSPMNLKSATNGAFGNGVNWAKDAMSFSNVPNATGANAALTSLRQLQLSAASGLGFPISYNLDANCANAGYDTAADYPPCTIKIIEND